MNGQASIAMGAALIGSKKKTIKMCKERRKRTRIWQEYVCVREGFPEKIKWRRAGGYEENSLYPHIKFSKNIKVL